MYRFPHHRAILFKSQYKKLFKSTSYPLHMVRFLYFTMSQWELIHKIMRKLPLHAVSLKKKWIFFIKTIFVYKVFTIVIYDVSTRLDMQGYVGLSLVPTVCFCVVTFGYVWLCMVILVICIWLSTILNFTRRF